MNLPNILDPFDLSVTEISPLVAANALRGANFEIAKILTKTINKHKADLTVIIFNRLMAAADNAKLLHRYKHLLHNHIPESISTLVRNWNLIFQNVRSFSGIDFFIKSCYGLIIN
jgi:hypothetical protein